MLVGDMFIAGTGRAVLATETVEEAIAAGRFKREWKKAGQRAVAVAPPGVSSVDLAVIAAQEAMRRAGRSPESIGPLIHSSWLGPDILGWPAASAIQKGVGAGNRCLPSLLSQGCAGGVIAIKHVVNALRCEPGEVGLVTAGDVHSAVDRWDFTGWPLGDHAGAVLIDPEKGFARIDAITHHSNPDLEGGLRGREPYGIEKTRYPVKLMDRIRDFFADIMSKEMFVALRDAGLLFTVRQVLDETGTDIDSFSRVALSLGDRVRVHAEYLDPIGIPEDRSTIEFGLDMGHGGPSDVLLGLDEITGSGQVGPGERFLLLGVGAGMVWAALAGTVLEAPPQGIRSAPMPLVTVGSDPGGTNQL